VTRGQVDNENNSQSQYSNISNNIQCGGLYIHKSESIAIRNGEYIGIQTGTQEGDEYSKDNTGMLLLAHRTGTGKGTRIEQEQDRD